MNLNPLVDSLSSLYLHKAYPSICVGFKLISVSAWLFLWSSLAFVGGIGAHYPKSFGGMHLADITHCLCLRKTV